MVADDKEIGASGGTGEFSMPGQIDAQFKKFADFVDQYSGLISLKGIFFASNEPEPVGSQLVLDFRLVDDFRLFNALGEVAWIGTDDEPVRLNGQAVSGMGIRFQALDAKGRNLIVRVLEEHVNMGGAPFEVERVPPVALLDIPGVAARPEPDLDPGVAEQLQAEPELEFEEEDEVQLEDELELLDDDEVELAMEEPDTATPEVTPEAPSLPEQPSLEAADGSQDGPEAVEVIAGAELADRLGSLPGEPSTALPGFEFGEDFDALFETDSDADQPPPENSEEDTVSDVTPPQASVAAAADGDEEKPHIHRLSNPSDPNDRSGPMPDLQWGEEIPGLESELANSLPPASAQLDDSALDSQPTKLSSSDLSPAADAAVEESGDVLGDLGSPVTTTGDFLVPAREEAESPLEETQDSYVAWRPEGLGKRGIGSGIAQRARSARPQLLALTLILVLAALGWLYRDTLVGWVGVGSRPVATAEGPAVAAVARPAMTADEDTEQPAPEPVQESSVTTEPSAVVGTTDPSSPPAAAAPDGSGGEETPRARVDDSLASPGGRVAVAEPLISRQGRAQSASLIRSITWSQEGDATVVTLVADGELRSSQLKVSRFRSQVRPRDLLVLRGIEQPFTGGTMRIGNDQLERIRIGFHPDHQPSQLHVVFDLASSAIETSAPRVEGDRLEITFRRL